LTHKEGPEVDRKRQPELTLYYSPGACSLASHIALEEAGAVYTIDKVSVHEGETRSARYLAINPRARVPALSVDGAVLTESCAILTYIADLFPAAALMPATAWERANCLSLMAWVASTVHPAFAHVVKPNRFALDEEAHPSLIETNTRAFWANLRELDALLGDRSWIVGEQFTICDAYALPFWGFGRRIRLPMGDLRSFTAWKQRMISRPAVFRVLQRENSLLLRPDVHVSS
jgi:glutathione S-transferase